MKPAHLRNKNKFKDNNFPIAIGLIAFCALAGIRMFFMKGKIGSLFGGMILILCFIFFMVLLYNVNKIKKFYKYANNFEDKDTWLPNHFAVGMTATKTLSKAESIGIDIMLDEIDANELITGIEKDLEYLHSNKKKAEQKLKEWKSVPRASNQQFNNIKIRRMLKGRTAIYSPNDFSEIERGFIKQIDFHDQTIARANKLLNKVRDKGGDIRKSIKNISEINGLNTSNGFYLGQDNKQKPYFYENNTHILTVAQSGAGKNTSLIMPNLLMDRFEGTKIILDLKGENAAVCSHWRKKENKGSSYILNPWQVFGMSSIAYNPFCLLDPFEDDFYSDCNSFSDVIIPVKDGQSDTGEHFDELARDFIASFLMYLTIKNYPETPTPATLYDEIIRATASVKVLEFTATDMEGIPHPDESIKRALELSAITFKGLISTGDNNELRGVKTTISRALKAFKGKQLYNTVQSDKETSKDLLNTLFHSEGNNDLYISFPQSEMNEAKLWLRLVLASFIRANTKNKPNKPVLFVLDEFPQLGTFNIVRKGISFLRSYNIQFWIICQNLDQLTTNYGKNGKQEIVENCTVSQFFNVKDDTAKYVSEKLDKFSRIVENYNTHEYKSNFERLRKTRSEVEQEQDTFTFIGQHEALLLQRVPYYEMDNVKDRAAPNPLFYEIEAYENYISQMNR
ncbi:type IV secretory system conjugative DNA transfer family protein [uncultured Dokdonia sp.]|uniref:type IV secretory system conjugative DNA transfer family protein n=1 Tax=uncultured Dokdonia sp. TaxID=575653 RepID=UPI00261ABB5B|nr:type IV secretory system conjugative DNA transfer family protein [uncultured Dokdonia sp.]